MKKITLWVILIAIVVACVTVLCLFIGLPGVGDGNSDPPSAETEPRSLDELRTLFPEYFGLDTTDGLLLYAREDASGAIGFSLLASMNQKRSVEELLSCRTVSAEEMKRIISTYDIPENQIAVAVSGRVFQFLLNCITPDEVRELFSAEFVDCPYYTSYMDIYDSAVFDIDNDGVAEECFITGGRKSGFMSYTLIAVDPESRKTESTSNYSGTVFPHFRVMEDGETVIAERQGNEVTYLSVSYDYERGLFCFEEHGREEVHSPSPQRTATSFEVTLRGRKEKLNIDNPEMLRILTELHIWGSPKDYSAAETQPLCRIEGFAETGEALAVFTILDENTVSSSRFEGYAHTYCAEYILSYFDYLLANEDYSYRCYAIRNIEIWQHGELELVIKDTDTVKELVSMLGAVGGTPGESTRGYDKSQYSVVIVCDGGSRYAFDVWDENKFSSWEHRDKLGSELFLEGADLSRLYSYLNKLCPLTE